MTCYRLGKFLYYGKIEKEVHKCITHKWHNAYRKKTTSSERLFNK